MEQYLEDANSRATAWMKSSLQKDDEIKELRAELAELKKTTVKMDTSDLIDVEFGLWHLKNNTHPTFKDYRARVEKLRKKFVKHLQRHTSAPISFRMRYG